jgi:hypothetical protein
MLATYWGIRRQDSKGERPFFRRSVADRRSIRFMRLRARLTCTQAIKRLPQQFSRRANLYRGMPFRPCYRRVRPLPDPFLCRSCVGRSSPGQPPRTRSGRSVPARSKSSPPTRTRRSKLVVTNYWWWHGGSYGSSGTYWSHCPGVRSALVVAQILAMTCVMSRLHDQIMWSALLAVRVCPYGLNASA